MNRLCLIAARARTWVIALAIAATCLALPGTTAAQQPATPPPSELLAYPTLILFNGKVLTVDERFTIAQAVAVRDGRILAVGTTADVKRFAGPDTRMIDLAGGSVVPGFIDSDGDNAFAGGDLYKDTMVNGKVGQKVRGENVTEMMKMVTALAAQAKAGSPVFVRMADEWIAELSKLTAKQLDTVAPNNPLMLSLSSSEGIVNTTMLDKAFAAGFPVNTSASSRTRPGTRPGSFSVRRSAWSAGTCGTGLS